jgi:hypothetical protein
VGEQVSKTFTRARQGKGEADKVEQQGSDQAHEVRWVSIQRFSMAEISEDSVLSVLLSKEVISDLSRMCDGLRETEKAVVIASMPGERVGSAEFNYDNAFVETLSRSMRRATHRRVQRCKVAISIL